MQVKVREQAQDIDNQARLAMYRQRLNVHKTNSKMEFPVLVDRCRPLPARVREQLSM